ncbi:putative gelsolin repeat protein [Eutypa lata UCREL1]|uniref:Putative gelsolin repeat protein n=1 Tax=Eutypa lata (strain UCR-EL1) TaxID=1287681 RepID=M7TBP9_EUTLA|nr:putative gelsolin repeat protein [Eutypa lata UCREL1]
MAGPNLAAGFNRSSSQTSSTVTDEKAAIETTDGHDTTSPSTAEKPKPEVKPKPDTPPVKDFRASLKSRQTPSTSTGNAPAAEFKNVFGNLRKTTAQSYKPPDELKDNIMKGKAALNNTGGPQKPERKDEFKEAILARKKSFHQVQSEGRGVTRNNSAASETPVPEGLVKRIELQRTGTWKRDSAAVDGVTIDPKRSSVASKPDLVENASDKPERASLHKKKDSTLDSLKAKLTDEPSTKPGFQGETNAPGRLPGRLAGGALANRFNPALAGLLARGPPGSSGSGSAPRSNSQSDDSARDIGTEAGSGRRIRRDLMPVLFPWNLSNRRGRFQITTRSHLQLHLLYGHQSNYKTSRQLFQFSADGKKIPVPSHRERTLFEREMYLCVHTFNNEAGKKTTEVYFWAGDEVPQSAAEDASIFVSRETRAVGGQLVKLQQNKETPEFLQALGGIVITQRGSGNKYDSLAPHMLCGRRHLGHVVFDEVDFTPSSLCSGFPYVITQAGRCYLWKGKGSGVDELSCARLIGMDFALSGEMEEIEDGHESSNFWNLFDGGSKSASADHWRLKPSYDKYCGRLFYSDAASRQQIVELSPFSQGDLKPTGIYILDAFFEMYIIVGSRAQSQYASFHNALDFAQEYAILAAGMEDRPFVPISTVVLEGIPRDMKSVFRKWRDTDSPTTMNVSGAGTGLKRGRSLRVMPLNQALQALSG